jgi:hypothetical protein
MTTQRRILYTVLLTGIIVILALHGMTALQPALPPDMPTSSSFIQSGFNVARSEPLGNWISCREDADRSADSCRVTDNKGIVIFQGEFLSMSRSSSVPNSELKVANRTEARNLWIQGPSFTGPIPVIPLTNGDLLIPAEDSQVLRDRWNHDPDELSRLQRQ